MVYQRTDEDRFTGPDGRLTAVGEALLEPCRAGTLACVNAPGSGVADDKVVHAHVDRLVPGCSARSRSCPRCPRSTSANSITGRRRWSGSSRWWSSRAARWAARTWCCGATPRRTVRRETLAQLEREPDGWVAQELVTLSVHPTVCGSALEPRHVDLRPYALASSRGVTVAGALSRVALEQGSMIVNSGRAAEPRTPGCR